MRYWIVAQEISKACLLKYVLGYVYVNRIFKREFSAYTSPLHLVNNLTEMKFGD